MSRSVVQSSEFVSFVVMLLMIVALVAGQADATVHRSGNGEVADQTMVQDQLNIGLAGQPGNTALTISIDVATDMNHFRGEDE